MRKTSFALIALALLLLASSAYGWWDTSYARRRPVNLPDANMAFGETIQVPISSLIAQADMDDLRIYDENNATELARNCRGSNSDGNCYFRLPYNMISDDAAIDSTYYLYYSNGSAGTPSKGDATDTNSCGFEATEYCNLTTVGADSALEARFGSQSHKMDNVEQLTKSAGLGARSGDLNYSMWLFVAKTPSTANTFYLNASDGTKCEISLRVDGKFYVKPDNTLTDTGITYDLNTWYDLHIYYQEPDLNCTFTVYKDDGSVVLTRLENIFWPVGGPGSAVTGMLFDTGANDLSFVDNFFTGAPTLAAVGAEEKGATTTEEVDVNAWRVDGFDDDLDQYPTFVLGVDGNLTLDFNVFNVDNNRMLIDINYSTTAVQGTGTPIVEDLNLDSSVCTDQDFQTSSSCSWDFNFAGVSDGNYFILFDLNGGGTNSVFATNFEATSKSFRLSLPIIRMRFYDENTDVPLVGLSVTAGSQSDTTDQNGQVQFSFGIATDTTVTVTAWEDDNYSTRYFEFDLNGAGIIDTNAMMLRDVNGFTVDFEFYAVDETTLLPNTRVYAYFEDGNLAGIRSTDASGETSFFLHPDSNYYFVANDVRYHCVLVTSLVPKDEDALTLVSPYSLLVSGFASRQFTNQSDAAGITNYIFSNTDGFYVFDFNAGLEYYTRQYELRLRGNPSVYTLQPYLVKVSDSGDFIFNVVDSQTLNPLEGIRIVIQRTLPGEGVVEMHSITTDEAGTATISLLIGKEYTAFFYYNDSLVHTATLRPTTGSLFYQVALNIGDLEPDTVIIGVLDADFFPETFYIIKASDGTVDINVTVRLIDKAFDVMTIRILDTNNTVYETRNFTSPWTDGNQVTFLDVNVDSPRAFSARYSLYVIVDVNDVDGNSYRATSIHYDVISDATNNLFLNISNLANSLNAPGTLATTSFIAMFLTIMVIGFIAIGGVHNPFVLSILSVMVLAMFAFIGWVDPVIVTIIAIVVFASALLLPILGIGRLV